MKLFSTLSQTSQILAIVQNIELQLTKVLANLATIQNEQHPNVLNQVLSTVTAIQTKESRMADVLDTVLADVNQEVTDLQNLTTEIGDIISVLQQIQSGAIAADDPRFQNAISMLQNMDASINNSAANIKAALPAPAAAQPATAAKP